MRCPHCYAPTTRDADFCLQCNKPLGPITVVRPVADNRLGLVGIIGVGTAFTALVIFCLLAVGLAYLYSIGYLDQFLAR